MLLRIAGLEPHRHDRTAVADIVARCGYLPLAIALAAARLRSHPRWTAHHLPPDRQHLVRLLGVHPGPEIDAYAVAALSGTTLSDAREHLEALHADHLIRETTPGRYQLHDLLRVYATTLATGLDPDDHDHALDQVLNYYLHTATTATAHLPRYTTEPATPPTPMPWWAPVPVQVLGGALLAVGVAQLLHSFFRFVVEGLGTPMPAAPPQHLVVGGFYRFVRNPMYVALLAGIIGQALLFGKWGVLVYAAIVWTLFAVFVHWREELMLARRFGTEHETYKRAVRAWWPRLRPWDPSALGTDRITAERGKFG